MVLIPLALIGCQSSSNTTPAAKEYPIKGKVVAVDSSKPSVKLDHEAIPALNMKAMGMDYPVENAKVLEGITVGEEVQGHLKAESRKYDIVHLEERNPNQKGGGP
jgi:Cu/Ag efflux protein CusF